MKCLSIFLIILIILQNIEKNHCSNTNLSSTKELFMENLSKKFNKNKSQQEINKNIVKNFASGEELNFLFLDFIFRGLLNDSNEKIDENYFINKDVCYPFLFYLECPNKEINRIKLKLKYLNFKYGIEFSNKINEILCLSYCINKDMLYKSNDHKINQSENHKSDSVKITIQKCHELFKSIKKFGSNQISNMEDFYKSTKYLLRLNRFCTEDLKVMTGLEFSIIEKNGILFNNLPHKIFGDKSTEIIKKEIKKKKINTFIKNFNYFGSFQKEKESLHSNEIFLRSNFELIFKSNYDYRFINEKIFFNKSYRNYIGIFKLILMNDSYIPGFKSLSEDFIKSILKIQIMIVKYLNLNYSDESTLNKSIIVNKFNWFNFYLLENVKNLIEDEDNFDFYQKMFINTNSYSIIQDILINTLIFSDNILENMVNKNIISIKLRSFIKKNYNFLKVIQKENIIDAISRKFIGYKDKIESYIEYLHLLNKKTELNQFKVKKNSEVKSAVLKDFENKTKSENLDENKNNDHGIKANTNLDQELDYLNKKLDELKKKKKEQIKFDLNKTKIFSDLNKIYESDKKKENITEIEEEEDINNFAEPLIVSDLTKDELDIVKNDTLKMDIKQKNLTKFKNSTKFNNKTISSQGKIKKTSNISSKNKSESIKISIIKNYTIKNFSLQQENLKLIKNIFKDKIHLGKYIKKIFNKSNSNTEKKNISEFTLDLYIKSLENDNFTDKNNSGSIDLEDDLLFGDDIPEEENDILIGHQVGLDEMLNLMKKNHSKKHKLNVHINFTLKNNTDINKKNKTTQEKLHQDYQDNTKKNKLLLKPIIKLDTNNFEIGIQNQSSGNQNDQFPKSEIIKSNEGMSDINDETSKLNENKEDIYPDSKKFLTEEIDYNINKDKKGMPVTWKLPEEPKKIEETNSTQNLNDSPIILVAYDIQIIMFTIFYYGAIFGLIILYIFLFKILFTVANNYFKEHQYVPKHNYLFTCLVANFLIFLILGIILYKDMLFICIFLVDSELISAAICFHHLYGRQFGPLGFFVFGLLICNKFIQMDSYLIKVLVLCLISLMFFYLGFFISVRKIFNYEKIKIPVRKGKERKNRNPSLNNMSQMSYSNNSYIVSSRNPQENASVSNSMISNNKSGNLLRRPSRGNPRRSSSNDQPNDLHNDSYNNNNNYFRKN